MNKSDITPIPTKHELCIVELLKAGPNGIHKIGKPQYSYGETCLPTTISELGRKRGLIIHRERRNHEHRSGGSTFFTWYWFPDREAATEALELMNKFRIKRQAAALSEEAAECLLSQFPESMQSA